MNINIENETKWYPKVLKHKYEKIVHRKNPYIFPIVPLSVSFLVFFTVSKTITPATIEYSKFNNQAINMAKELPKDNFIILSVLILFKYKPPLDKSTIYILS